MDDLPIDLRSDTVTRPSPEMRAAMAAAPVGDDQYGEDPTTNRLQEHLAALLGKEAALWLPSGTMANQVALRVLTRPGDDVIVSRESHAVWHETGGSAAMPACFREIGARGIFQCGGVRRRGQARDHGIYPPTTLMRSKHAQPRGGVVFGDEIEHLCRGRRRHRPPR
jgi:threonine aldolase